MSRTCGLTKKLGTLNKKALYLYCAFFILVMASIYSRIGKTRQSVMKYQRGFQGFLKAIYFSIFQKYNECSIVLLM